MLPKWVDFIYTPSPSHQINKKRRKHHVENQEHYQAFRKREKGEGFLDVAMKILIVVVIGAAILLILNAAMPNLFSDLIDKVGSELYGVEVLP